MAIDEAKLNDFMGKFVADLGAVMHAATVVVGDQLGLYKALAAEPQSAEAAGPAHRDRPALPARVAVVPGGGRLRRYDPASDTFSMSEEQAFALAVEGSPAFIPGAFQVAVAQFKAIPKMTQAFRTGLGLGWHEHDVGAVPRHRAVLPARLRRQPRRQLDPFADGVEKRAEGGREGRRRGLRPRRLDPDHGRGVPDVDLRRLRLSRAVDRARARRREEGGRRRPRQLRGRERQGASRARTTTW